MESSSEMGPPCEGQVIDSKDVKHWARYKLKALKYF